jgi:hypothetical protein
LEERIQAQAHGGLTGDELERAARKRRGRKAKKLEQVGALETECRARDG